MPSPQQVLKRSSGGQDRAQEADPLPSGSTGLIHTRRVRAVNATAPAAVWVLCTFLPVWGKGSESWNSSFVHRTHTFEGLDTKPTGVNGKASICFNGFGIMA